MPGKKAKRSHRPERIRLSPEEAVKRMEEFPLRKDKIIAALRDDKPLAAALDEIYGTPTKRRGENMKKKPRKSATISRPEREKLTLEESLKRVLDLPKRKDKIIAAIRKGTA